MILGTKFSHNCATLCCKKDRGHVFTFGSNFQRFLSERYDCYCCQTELLDTPTVLTGIVFLCREIQREYLERCHTRLLPNPCYPLLAPSPLSEGRAVSAVEVWSVAVMTISRTDWCHLPTDLLASLNEHK